MPLDEVGVHAIHADYDYGFPIGAGVWVAAGGEKTERHQQKYSGDASGGPAGFAFHPWLFAESSVVSFTHKMPLCFSRSQYGSARNGWRAATEPAEYLHGPFPRDAD
jgi:hypothetical protein